MNWDDYPLIAACGGAWSETGRDGPTCQRGAGNHAQDAAGTGCSAADLCPAGWHVCYGPEDVAQRLGGNDCSDAVDPRYPSLGSGALAPGVTAPPGGAFFMTAALDEGATCSDSSEAGGGLFGCGTMGAAIGACGVLDRGAGSQCAALRDASPAADDRSAVDYGYTSAEWAWSCAGPTPVKSVPDTQGGVLCCKDSDESLAEVCDGSDNDWDGMTDEVAFGGGALIETGSACRESGQCGTLCCTFAAGWECAELAACTVDASCDGIDDDGDGARDEDFGAVAIECGIGACKATGQRTCVAGALVDTCTPGAKAEANDLTCDGIDGDCDGGTDEDLVCETAARDPDADTAEPDADNAEPDPDPATVEPDPDPATAEPTEQGGAGSSDDSDGCHGGGLDAGALTLAHLLARRRRAH